MTAASYDLLIEQGATFRFATVYGHQDGTLDAEGNAVVTPYDITGCKARLQVRTRRGAQVLLSATTGNGGIVLDGPAGRITVTFTDEATDSLTVRRARYDLEVEYANGDVVRVLQGCVTVSPNITADADLDNISPAAVHLGVDEQDIAGPV